jgi:HEAT repeat protein
MLGSADPVRRRMAVEHIEAALPPSLGAPLLIARLGDADATVRARAAQALGRLRALDAAPQLVEHLSDPEAQVRAACAEALGRFGVMPPGLSRRAAAAIARALGDAQHEVRLDVLRAVDQLLASRGLSAVELPLLLGPILLRVDDENVGVRKGAVAVLGRLGSLPPGPGADGQDLRGRAVLPLLGRLSDSARDVRAEALASLGALQVVAAAPAALRMLRDPAEEVQRRAALCLGQIGGAAAVPPLVDLFLGPGQGPGASDPLRAAAATALAQIARRTTDAAGVEAALRGLLTGLARDDLRPAARAALLSLGPVAIPAAVARLSQADGQTEISALLHLLRDLAPAPAAIPAALRARVGAALVSELSSGRVPREVVLDALGHVGDRSSAAACAGLLTDRDVVVRRHAVQALRRPPLLDARALDALLVASRDPDGEVRQGAIAALGALREAGAGAPLSALLQRRDLDADTRAAVADALGRIYGGTAGPVADRGVLAALVAALTSPSLADSERRVRRAAAAALGEVVGRAPALSAQVLLSLTAPLRRGGPGQAQAGGPHPEIVAALAGVLRARPPGDPGGSAGIGRETLLDLAETGAEAFTPEAALALDALAGLGAARDPQSAGRLGRLLGHRDPLRRARAAFALGCVLGAAPPGALPDGLVAALVSLLSGDPDARVRAEAAWALGRLPLPPSGAGPQTRRAIAGLRSALARPAGTEEPSERANVVAALALLRAGAPADAELLTDRDPGVRANGALLLASGGPGALSPGLRARLRSLQVGDPVEWVRRSAGRALQGRAWPEADRAGRRHFLGLYLTDYDRRPLPEARLRLYTPDGLVRVAAADGRGVVREEQLPQGGCEVEVLDDGMRPQ